MLGLQTKSMGVCNGSVGGRRSADWLCPYEPSSSRVGSLDELSDVLPGILVPARPRRNAPVVLQLVYSTFRLEQFEEPAGEMASSQLFQRLPTRGLHMDVIESIRHHSRSIANLSLTWSRARHNSTLHHHWRQTTRPKQMTASCDRPHQHRPSLENAQKGSLHQL